MKLRTCSELLNALSEETLKGHLAQHPSYTGSYSPAAPSPGPHLESRQYQRNRRSPGLALCGEILQDGPPCSWWNLLPTAVKPRIQVGPTATSFFSPSALQPLLLSHTAYFSTNSVQRNVFFIVNAYSFELCSTFPNSQAQIPERNQSICPI